MTYYEVLDIKENATDEEIKKAYFRMSKKNQPNIHGDSIDFHLSMCKINEANEILSNKQKKINYDRSLEKQREHLASKYVETCVNNEKNVSTIDINEVKQMRNISKLVISIFAAGINLVTEGPSFDNILVAVMSGLFFTVGTKTLILSNKN